MAELLRLETFGHAVLVVLRVPKADETGQISAGLRSARGSSMEEMAAVTRDIAGKNKKKKAEDEDEGRREGEGGRCEREHKEREYREKG